MFICPIPGEQVVDQPQHRRAAGHLARVDVGVNERGGLVSVMPRLDVRQRHHPDVAPLVTPADTFHVDQRRVFPCPGVQQLRQERVRVVPIWPILGRRRYPMRYPVRHAIPPRKNTPRKLPVLRMDSSPCRDAPLSTLPIGATMTTVLERRTFIKWRSIHGDSS